MIKRYIFIILAAGLLLRIGYMYFEAGRGIPDNTEEVPSLFYGRSLEIRKNTHLGKIRFTDRLNRLTYRQVTGTPSAAGTFSEDTSRIRIFLRNQEGGKASIAKGPVDLLVRDDRVEGIISSSGAKLDSIHLEREEIGRIPGRQKEFRQPLSLSKISPDMQNAVIAVEDSRFYSLTGIGFPETFRSWFSRSKEQRFAQSRFSIARQLAKHFFLSPEKTTARKLREAEMTFILKLRYSKKQLLEMYLNSIYLGQNGSQGIYGVERAANLYFSKHPKNLSLEEAAMLAGMIHAPDRYRNLKAAKARRDAVLESMKRFKMISENDFIRASNAPLRMRQSSMPPPTSYFVDYIQRITKEDLGTEKLYHGGYRYETSLDPIFQAMAEEAVVQGLTEIEQRAFPAGQPLQAALVAVDPLTGETIAMVGGRNYRQNRFNRAIDAKRQPGSAFKPFVLLTALSQSLRGKEDLTLSSLISGEPISLLTPEGMWSPANFEDKKYGMITVRKSLEDSVNTATTRLANDLGFDEVLRTARLAGITSPLEAVPSMPLGSFEVTPRELAYAYTTVASGGIRFDPFALSSVTTARGDVLIAKMVKQKKAFDPRVTYLAAYAMEGVLERGTAIEAKDLGLDFPASGKTGTTNGNRDSWFVGFTPDVVCAVWVGYDTGADTGLTGAQGALHIWTRFMRSVYSRSKPSIFIPPKGIQMAVIDPKTGYLATRECPKRFNEAYLEGTAPDKSCPEHPEKLSRNNKTRPKK